VIHPTALVHPNARLGANVRVGAYAVIGTEVEIGDNCKIGPHTVIEGPTRLGPNNHVFAHACVGLAPQDIGFEDEPTRLEIGARNVIREFATLNRGTMKDRRLTTVGNDNMFMAYSHVAHDCIIGDHVIMANAATLAGHVTVGDHVNIAGLCAIHQFVRIGAHVMLGGGSMVPLDIPPFTVASGDRARLHGLNIIGLQRRGFGSESIRQLKYAYKLLFRSDKPLRDAIVAVREAGLDAAPVIELLDFLSESKRGITR
jgi:UDP-N-acetylglucosamine acyltransferase